MHARQRRKIIVLRLEPEELREERQRLVGGAHGDGAADGGDHRGEAEDEVEHASPRATARRPAGNAVWLAPTLTCSITRMLTTSASFLSVDGSVRDATRRA